VIKRTKMTNATHLVIADPVLGLRLEEAGEPRLLTRIGRFSVFERTGWTSEWVVPVQGDAALGVEKYATVAVEFHVSTTLEERPRWSRCSIIHSGG
jgi:hypothetical protein